MKNSRLATIIYSVTVVVIIVTGIFWWRWDIHRIKQVEYKKRAQLLNQYRQSDPHDLLAELKKYVHGRFMYIIDEYQVDSTTYEIIGYSRDSWLFSGFIHKVTIIGNPHFDRNRAVPIPVSISVYGSHLAAGALAYFSISAFCLLAIAGLLIKRENLSHLFTESRASGKNNNFPD